MKTKTFFFLRRKNKVGGEHNSAMLDDKLLEVAREEKERNETE